MPCLLAVDPIAMPSCCTAAALHNLRLHTVTNHNCHLHTATAFTQRRSVNFTTFAAAFRTASGVQLAAAGQRIAITSSLTMDQPAEEEGFYSSTSGTYFPDKQALAEHYASDLHRYNLKRKVAGLPPVTKDWFDARKEQLTLSSGGSEVQKVYYDPLTRRKFMSRNAYMNKLSRAPGFGAAAAGRA